MVVVLRSFLCSGPPAIQDKQPFAEKSKTKSEQTLLIKVWLFKDN